MPSRDVCEPTSRSGPSITKVQQRPPTLPQNARAYPDLWAPGGSVERRGHLSVRYRGSLSSTHPRLNHTHLFPPPTNGRPTRPSSDGAEERSRHLSSASASHAGSLGVARKPACIWCSSREDTKRGGFLERDRGDQDGYILLLCDRGFPCLTSLFSPRIEAAQDKDGIPPLMPCHRNTPRDTGNSRACRVPADWCFRPAPTAPVISRTRERRRRPTAVCRDHCRLGVFFLLPA